MYIVVNDHAKVLQKHWLEQWFVIAKSRAALPWNPYKTCHPVRVLLVRSRVDLDLIQNVTLFALKQYSKCKKAS